VRGARGNSRSHRDRYNALLFVPDVYGDILFNGVSSNVYRESFMNGVQSDNSYKITEVHTIRAGFNSSVEQGIVRTVSTVEPVDATGRPERHSASPTRASKPAIWSAAISRMSGGSPRS
jgi:hypothetical protein